MNTSPLQSPPSLPPERVVEIDVYSPPGVEAGYHEAWLKLHEPGVPDLVWTPLNGGHWIATRGTVISQVYADYAHFSNRVMMVPKLNGDGRCPRHIIPSYVDPPEHRPYRNLLNSTFSPRNIAAMEPTIRALAVDLIEQVRDAGHCDFSSAYAEILPIQIFMSMVELPFEDVPMVKGLVEQVTRPDTRLDLEQSRRRISEAHDSIHAYLAPHIQARIGSDRPDMFSRMINAQIGDRPLDAQEMRDICTQVMFGGLDTVVNFMQHTMLFLARSPSHRRQLIDDPTLIPAAIDELLRRFPVVTVGREVRQDCELDGVQLRKGDMIMAPTALAGLDERLNERPLEVDFHREAAEHVTFGQGHHRCPGATLARAEVRITIEEWLARIPEFEVTPGAAIRYRGGVVGGIEALPLCWPTAGSAAA